MTKEILKELQDIKILLEIIVSNQEQFDVDISMGSKTVSDMYANANWSENLPKGDINNPIPEAIQCNLSKGVHGKEQ